MGGRFIWMDRHLGATSNTAGDVGTIGLTYQWGRKDPFPMPQAWGSTEPTLQSIHGELVTAVDKTLTNDNTPQVNLTNSINNPLSFIKKASGTLDDWYKSSASSTDLWYGWDRTEGGCFQKSPFDPCPKGWRVPTHQYNEEEKAIYNTSPWQNLINKTALEGTTGNQARIWDDFGTYPILGYRTQSGAITGTTTYAYTWSASTENTNDSKTYTFYYGKSPLAQQSLLGKTFGFSVRCVKE